MPEPSPGERRALVIVVLAAVAARIAVVLSSDGVIYPDEVYQSLEQAHRISFGTGLIPWEWQEGARHPLLAWSLVPVMLAGEALGIAPQLAARLVLGAAGGLVTWSVFSLARALGAAPRTSLAAAALWAFASWAVLLGPRGLSESAATLPLTAGMTLVAPSSTTTRRILAAGGCFSIAVMFRLQVALVVPVALGSIAMQRRWREVALLSASLTAGALVFGVLDAIAWSELFHSAKTYVRFNLLEARAAEFGVEPASYYLQHAWKSLGGVLVAIVAGFAAPRRAWGVLAAIAVFVALHVAQPHKELRFLLPVLPLACALVALSLDRVPMRFARFALVAVLAAIATQPMPWQLTFSMLGVPLENARAIDDGGSVNRLLATAGRRADVCGLMLTGRELGYSGGYAWFHAKAPLYDVRQPSASESAWNTVIARADAAPPGERLAADGDFVLLRVRAQCIEEPWDARLR